MCEAAIQSKHLGKTYFSGECKSLLIAFLQMSQIPGKQRRCEGAPVPFTTVHRMHSYDASEFALVHHEGLVLLLLLLHKAQEEHTMMPLYPFLRGLL